jgi:hypothetical protein
MSFHSAVAATERLGEAISAARRAPDESSSRKRGHECGTPESTGFSPLPETASDLGFSRTPGGT